MQEKTDFWAQGKKYARIVAVLISIILAIFGILVPILLEDEKQLSLEVIENKPLISVDQKIREEIMISYNDEVMERLFLLTLKFVNTGDLGINGKTDIVERIEISLQEDNCKIIGEPEILENPNNVKLKFYPTMDQKTIKFDFDLMNSNDYFLMDLLYTGDELADPDVHAKIVDIKDIEIRSKMESSEKEHKRSLAWITGILGGFFVVISGLYWASRSEKDFTSWGWESKRGKNMRRGYLTIVVMGSFMFYTGVLEIASQLEYELLGVYDFIFVIIYFMASIIALALIIKKTFFARK